MISASAFSRFQSSLCIVGVCCVSSTKTAGAILFRNNSERSTPEDGIILTANSTVFWSSRTFPGQLYSSNASQKSSPIFRQLLFMDIQNFRIKLPAIRRISPARFPQGRNRQRHNINTIVWDFFPFMGNPPCQKSLLYKAWNMPILSVFSWYCFETLQRICLRKTVLTRIGFSNWQRTQFSN